MPVVEGFRALTSGYLGQDWKLFGPTIDEAIAAFISDESTEDIADSIKGFEELLATPMTEQEYYDRWIYGLHSGYDPRDHGYTFPEWFAHALDILRAQSGTPTD